MERSRPTISLMFSICADGKILPPVVLYRTKNVYNWCNGGVRGGKYYTRKMLAFLNYGLRR